MEDLSDGSHITEPKTRLRVTVDALPHPS